MSITIAPLLCLSVLGKLGNKVTYDRVNGQNIVKAYSKPTDPASAAQQNVRGIFRYSSEVWRQSHLLLRTPWAAKYYGTPEGIRTSFIGANLQALAGQQSLTGFVMSPAVGWGMITPAPTVTPGAGSLLVTINTPVLPAGYLANVGQFLVLLDQDPADQIEAAPNFWHDRRAPFVRNFTGLQSGKPYIISVALWIRGPAASRFYTHSFATFGTPL
jgi:hypothetical protein